MKEWKNPELVDLNYSYTNAQVDYEGNDSYMTDAKEDMLEDFYGKPIGDPTES